MGTQQATIMVQLELQYRTTALHNLAIKPHTPNPVVVTGDIQKTVLQET